MQSRFQISGSIIMRHFAGRKTWRWQRHDVLTGCRKITELLSILRQAVKPLSRKIITEIFSPFFYQRLSNYEIAPKTGRMRGLFLPTRPLSSSLDAPQGEYFTIYRHMASNHRAVFYTCMMTLIACDLPLLPSAREMACLYSSKGKRWVIKPSMGYKPCFMNSNTQS